MLLAVLMVGETSANSGGVPETSAEIVTYEVAPKEIVTREVAPNEVVIKEISCALEIGLMDGLTHIHPIVKLQQ